MKHSNLELAIAEAKRFLKATKRGEKAIFVDAVLPGQHSAAIKRSSLDLTRALAKLRNDA